MNDEKKANHWIDFCYEDLASAAGAIEHGKEFNEGYHLVKSIIKKHFEKAGKLGGEKE